MTKEREAVRRRAARHLLGAGRNELAVIGVRQAGSGPRRWIDDHGWWLINVEFQPSGFSVGSYLNVGLQHLWTPRDSMSLQYGSRENIELQGGYVRLDSADDGTVAQHAGAVARAARAAVLAWRSRLSDPQEHLTWLSQHRDGGWVGVDAAFALATLGRSSQAGARFAATAAELDPTIPWQNELAADCRHLALLVSEGAAFTSETNRRIDDCRQRLLLPEIADASRLALGPL